MKHHVAMVDVLNDIIMPKADNCICTEINYISVNTSILRNLGLHTVYVSAINTGHHSHTKEKSSS